MLILGVKVGGELQEFPVTTLPATIGRRQDNTIRIKDKFVSAYHAELRRNAAGELEIQDKGSFNGTFVNGRRLQENAVTVPLGAPLKLGVLDGLLFDDQDSASASLARGNAPVVVPLRERRAPITINGNGASAPSSGLAPVAVNGHSREAKAPPTAGPAAVAVAVRPSALRVAEAPPKQPSLDGGPAVAAQAAPSGVPESELKARDEVIAALKAEKKRFEEEVKSLQSAKTAAENRLSEVDREIHSGKDAIAKVRHEYGVLQERLKSLEESASVGAKAESEKNRLAGEVTRLSTLVAEQVSTTQKRDKEKSDAEAAQLASLRKENAGLQNRLKATEEALSQEQAKLSSLDAEKGHLEKRLKADLDDRTRALTAAEEKAARETTLLASMKAELATALSARTAELSSLGEEKSALEESLRKELEAKAQALADAERRAQEEAESLKSRLAASVEEKSVLEQRVKTGAETLAAVKATLEARAGELRSLDSDKSLLERTLREELEGQKRSASDELAQARREFDALTAVKAELAQSLGEKSKALEKLGTEKAFIESELQAACGQHAAALAAASEKEAADAAALASEKAAFRKHEQEREHLEQTLRGEISGLKQALAAAEEKAQSRAESLAATRSELTATLAAKAAALGALAEEKTAMESALRAELTAKAGTLAETEQKARADIEALVADKAGLAASLEAKAAELFSLREEKTASERKFQTELSEKTKTWAEGERQAKSEIEALAQAKATLETSLGERNAELATARQEKAALEQSLNAELEAKIQALKKESASLAETRTALTEARERGEGLAKESGERLSLLQAKEEQLSGQTSAWNQAKATLEKTLAMTQGELALARDALSASEADLRVREEAAAEQARQLEETRLALRDTQGTSDAKEEKIVALLTQVAALGAATAKVQELKGTLGEREQEIFQLKARPAVDPEHERKFLADLEAARRESTRMETVLAENQADLDRERRLHADTRRLLEETRACADTDSQEAFRLASRVKELEQALVARGDDLNRFERDRGESESALKSELGTLKSDLEKTQASLADNRGGREAAESKVRELSERVTTLEADLKAQGESATALRTELETERDRLASEGERLRSQLAKTETDLADRSRLLSEHRANLSETRQSLSSVQSLAEARDQEASRLGIRVAELVASAAARSVDVQLATEAMEKAQRELSQTRSEVEEMKSRLLAAEAERCRVLEGRASVDALREEVANQGAELERYRKATEAARQEHRQFSRETTETKARLETHLEELDHKIRDARATYEREEQEAFRARREAEQEAGRMETLGETIARQEQELRSIGSRLTEEKQESRHLERQLLPLREERSRMDSELAGLKAALAAATTEVNAKQALRDELKAAEKRLREVEASCHQLQEHSAAARQEANSSQERVRDLMRQRETMEQEISGQQRKLERRLRDLQLAEDRIQLASDLEDEITSRQTEVTERTRQLELVTNTVKHLQEERAMLNESLRKLKSDLAEMAPARSSGPAPAASRIPMGQDHRLHDLERKVKEYEDYQRILRESLRPDQATVEVMSRQLIKRIDLLDDLIALYRKDEATLSTSEQLAALRQGFLDMLDDHFVKPYSLDPGTPLNISERRRITIVESRTEGPGGDQGPTRVFKTVRPGYVCGAADASREQILRKAEVITVQ